MVCRTFQGYIWGSDARGADSLWDKALAGHWKWCCSGGAETWEVSWVSVSDKPGDLYITGTSSKAEHRRVGFFLSNAWLLECKLG
jgi:hypothetical protein